MVRWTEVEVAWERNIGLKLQASMTAHCTQQQRKLLHTPSYLLNWFSRALNERTKRGQLLDDQLDKRNKRALNETRQSKLRSSLTLTPTDLSCFSQ